MPRAKRRKLYKNIYADNHGYAIVVTYKGQRVEKRFPAELTLQTLKTHRETLLYDLAKASPIRGSLRADYEAYLLSLPAGRMKDNRERECRVWAKLGPFPRASITADMIARELAHMKFSASSKKKALTALKAVYRFHGDTETPVDTIKRPREQHEIRGIPQSVVTMILRQLPRSKTRARLKVLARTGLPHAQIAALQPHHLDLERREVTVTPRRKGRGVPARTLPITHKAVRAFKEFQREEAWGPFSRHSMWRMFQEAVTAAKAAWKGRWPAPEHLRPYDLRHAFATEVYRRSRDLRATAELLLHADMTMTARYAELAVTQTAQAARDLLEVPRESATRTIHTPPVRARKSRPAKRRNRGTQRRGSVKKA